MEILLIAGGGILLVIAVYFAQQQTSKGIIKMINLPPRLQQWFDFISNAAIRTKPNTIDIETWFKTIAGIIDAESKGGEYLKPPGPAGTGDFGTRWRDSVPNGATWTGATRMGQNGQTQFEISPPLIAPATRAGWGHGLGQIDWETGDETIPGTRAWIESGNWADPEKNINKTAEFLQVDYARAQNLTDAIALYNAKNSKSARGQAYASIVQSNANSYGAA